jgi:hypothetical protein
VSLVVVYAQRRLRPAPTTRNAGCVRAELGRCQQHRSGPLSERAAAAAAAIPGRLWLATVCRRPRLEKVCLVRTYAIGYRIMSSLIRLYFPTAPLGLSGSNH